MQHYPITCLLEKRNSLFPYWSLLLFHIVVSDKVYSIIVLSHALSYVFKGLRLILVSKSLLKQLIDGKVVHLYCIPHIRLSFFKELFLINLEPFLKQFIDPKVMHFYSVLQLLNLILDTLLVDNISLNTLMIANKEASGCKQRYNCWSPYRVLSKL